MVTLGISLTLSQEFTQVLRVADDLLAVAQDPIVLEVGASHSVLGEHLHTLIDLGGDEITPPIAVVALQELLKDGEAVVFLVRVRAHLDKGLHLGHVAPLGSQPQESRENVGRQLTKARHRALLVVADLNKLLSHVIRGVPSHVRVFGFEFG